MFGICVLIPIIVLPSDVDLCRI